VTLTPHPLLVQWS